jgi:hypothetical protein
MASLALAAAAAVAIALTPTVVPVDGETVVEGVPVACTGIGQTKADPKWGAYPVRIEFSNAAREYLRGGEVTVFDAKGAPILAVSCDAPWILLKLPKGAYSLEGRPLDSPAKPRTARFSPPASGQMRLVLAFPDA